MSCPARIHPLRKPPNHKAPIPRWKLALPSTTQRVYISYIGVQTRNTSDEAQTATFAAVSEIQGWLAQPTGPAASESFTMLDGYDDSSATVWVCYWDSSSSYDDAMSSLSLKRVHERLDAAGWADVGLWHETFSTPVSRLETNYSGLDYLPGLARLPGATVQEHDLSTYWGAARDRIPDSGVDLFPSTHEEKQKEAKGRQEGKAVLRGPGQRISGKNTIGNMVHIRSGQWWQKCESEEVKAYEEKLEPSLRQGLVFLRNNPEESGAMSIQYLRNQDVPSSTAIATDPANSVEKKGSCGAGFFRNLSHLESWAKSHKSHLAIYTGALRHYKQFGENRRFRTWHEVCVIGEGEGRWEYVNCTRGTGVLGKEGVDMECEEL